MKKIGVALSGGGLQAFSHIGALRAIEELGYEINYISGTSTGSMIASLYAIGFDTYEIENILKENYKKILATNKKNIVKAMTKLVLKKPTKIPGIIDGIIVEKMINKYSEIKNINNINQVKLRNLAISTVDTITMKECIFLSKEIEDKNTEYIYDITLGKAVRASMAFPGIFNPVNFKNYNFIDGGTVDNLPSEILKKMGAKKIISIGFDLSKYKPTNNMEDVIVRALDIFSLKDVKRGRENSDINIQIYNPNTSLVTMDEEDKTIKNGYDAVMNNLKNN